MFGEQTLVFQIRHLLVQNEVHSDKKDFSTSTSQSKRSANSERSGAQKPQVGVEMPNGRQEQMLVDASLTNAVKVSKSPLLNTL